MSNIFSSSSSSAAIQAYQQTTAQLFGTFSEGMQTLLARKDLDEQDQERLKRTAEIVQAVATRYLETAQDVQQLEAHRQGGQLQHMQGMVALLLSAKEKEINQAQEEFNLMREEADFLEIHLSHMQEIEQKRMPFNRREVHLKAPHPHFTGRSALLDAIKANLNDATPLVLYGPPGMGKTETAITFANRHLESYSIVWTIEAATVEQQERSYRELAAALLLPILKEDTPVTIRQRVHRKLEQLEKPWLLIFDNLETFVEFPQRGGHFLITARDKAPFVLYKHLEISSFTKSESLELLQKVSGEATSQEMADLAQYLGYYPLLLQQAANHIRLTPSVSVATYLASLKMRSLTANLADITPDERYTALFKLTLEETLAKLSPQALEWLKICAHLSPDCIPQTFLKEWVQSEKEEQAILVQLANRGLLRFDAQAQSFAMHRLYQAFLQNENSYQQTCVLLLKLIKKIDLKDLTTNWLQIMNQKDLLAEHFEAFFQHAWYARLSEEEQEAGLRWLGRYHLLKGHYARALEKMEEELQIKKKNLGDQHLHVAMALSDIGNCLQSQGNYALALQKYEEALHMWKRNWGDPDSGILIGIGGCLQSQGSDTLAFQKFEEALQIMKKTLQIEKEELGDQHPRLAAILHNIGAMFEIQGKFDNALQSFEEALQIRKKTLGDQHPDVARILNTIGNCLYLQGKFEEALQIMKDALPILKKALGDQHPEVALSLNSLGNCLQAQGKFDDALKKHEEALQILKKTLGDQHPRVSECLNKIAVTLANQGKFDDALKKYEEALQILRESLGSQHPAVASCLNNMGWCLTSQRKIKEAEDKYLQAYTLAKKVLGDNHPSTQLYLKNLKQADSSCTIT